MQFLPTWSALLLIIPAAGLMVAAGCSHQSTAKSVTEVVTPAAFVGSAICGECHVAEHRAHSASRHARTMMAMTPAALGPLAPPTGLLTPRGPVLRRAGQGYELTRAKDQNAARPLDLALGSGKTGMTYIAVVNKFRVAEVHMSYFPSRKQWFVTPNQEDMPDNAFGRTYPTGVSSKCILCHAVRTGDASLLPPETFFGVGCESCHGAGSAHVAAMRTGRTADLHIERLSTWGAARINTMCGHCHRTAADITRTEDYAATNRFAAYGLMLSPCYQQSHDALSCLNCHDPHTDASTDPQHYVAACLSCHARSGGATTTSARAQVVGKTCKVNPNDKCLDCHMPRRSVFHGVPISMRDHFIRVNPPGSL